VPSAPTVWPYQQLLDVGETQQCGRAVFEVHHMTAERVRIAVTGDVDATIGRTSDASSSGTHASLNSLSSI
jgi:hypothetical protein